MSSQDSRSLFREAVTSASFTLTLSRTQIQTLTAIGYQNRRLSPVTYPQWSVSLQALMRRGLVEAAPATLGRWGDIYVECFRLTEAGKLVFRLGQIAGLIPEKTPAQETVV